MKVIDLVSVNGRGRVACIDHLPEGLNEGAVVRQGDNRWLVTGIEHHALPQENIVKNGWPAGLLIRPIDGAPIDPELEGQLIRDVS